MKILRMRIENIKVFPSSSRRDQISLFYNNFWARRYKKKSQAKQRIEFKLERFETDELAAQESKEKKLQIPRKLNQTRKINSIQVNKNSSGDQRSTRNDY